MLDAYELMRDSARMARESAEWMDDVARQVKEGSLEAVESGKVVITAEQKSFSVRLTGRRHFLGFIGVAFRILLAGKATLKFRKAG